MTSPTSASVSTRPFPGSLPVVALGIALVPIAVAATRALARGWVAVGDNGLILMRAEDVATADHPLLGTWTSASFSAGRNINNPGPLWFDVLAPFVKVAGPSVGLVVGVAVANALAIVGAAVVARRVGGGGAMAVVTLLSAGLMWTMGSELLFDAWQPHAMLLPFWALLVVCWAVAAGDVALLPWLAGLASLIVQTHLSFVYVTTAVVVAAVVSTALLARRNPPVTARRTVGWTVGVVAVAWSQPIIDQLAGTGNLGELLDSVGGDVPPIGARLGARFVASVVVYPPWWGRPGFTDTVRATGAVQTGDGLDVAEGDIVSLRAAIVGLLVLFVVLAAIVVVGRRRAARSHVALAVVAAVAVGSALVSMRLMPIGAVGLSPHTMRWLWPISALVFVAVVLPAAEWTRARVALVPAATGVTLLLVALNIPTNVARLGPTADRAAMAAVAALVDGVDDYRPGGPVVFDVSTLRFAEPYSGPVLAALARNGIDVVVTDEVMVRQLGDRRRADGDERRRVVLIEGDGVRTPPDGARVVALAEGLTGVERDELDELRPRVLDLIRRTGLELNAAGLEASAAGRIPFDRIVLSPGGDPTELDALGWIGTLVAEGYVEPPADREAPLRRYAELERRSATRTVGLFELPLDAANDQP